MAKLAVWGLRLGYLSVCLRALSICHVSRCVVLPLCRGPRDYVDKKALRHCKQTMFTAASDGCPALLMGIGQLKHMNECPKLRCRQYIPSPMVTGDSCDS